MENALETPRPVRFAAFEVDLRAGELRKNGIKVKLSGQPFQVLCILLERPGEIVTREELQKRLWPDNFVDVDHNLNTAVNKIREALGDSSENPRFVETLPRRGYRFVGVVNGGAQIPERQLSQGETGYPKPLASPLAVCPIASWGGVGCSRVVLHSSQEANSRTCEAAHAYAPDF